ncbi:MAG: zinc-ribbon domain-containing protein, partial [Bacillota bacterium]
MYCFKCGAQIADESEFCVQCGAAQKSRTAEAYPVKQAKKRKTGLIIGLVAGCVIVAAAVVALVLLLPGMNRTATGDWYNKDLEQTLTFRADGTVLIATAYGQLEGS